MFILPEFNLKVHVESGQSYDGIESIRLELIPVPIDYRVSISRAAAMYQYFIYPTVGGVESREATKKGIVWLKDEEIDVLNTCEEDYIEFFNEFIDGVMGFKPFKEEEES